MADDEKITLPDGAEMDLEQFEQLETNLDREAPHEFEEHRLDKRRISDPVTPFTARPFPTLNRIAGKHHADRSSKARTADESFNAPIAPDYRTWKKNPNRYDLPGVDTIPEERAKERAMVVLEKAERSGAVKRVLEGGEHIGKESTKGSFHAPRRDLRMRLEDELVDEYPMFQYGPVLAHEVGHATDRKVFTDELDRNTDQIDPEIQRLYDEHTSGDFPDVDYFSDLLLEDDPELKAEIRKLSERKRGTIDDARAEVGNTWDSYRAENTELLADAFASYVVEPRAARREAPLAVAALEETFLPALERDRHGEPLEAT